MKRKATAVLLGAGSHARVVLDILEALGSPFRIMGALNLFRNTQHPSGTIEKIPIFGGIDFHRMAAIARRAGSAYTTERFMAHQSRMRAIAKRHLLSEGVEFAIPSIGDNLMREKASEWAKQAGFKLVSLFHPAATISTRAKIGAGTIVCARAVIGTGSWIGTGVIVNTGAQIDHDGQIGDFAHVAPGAVLGGNVTVGERAWVGLGARVREGVQIGTGAIVGAGAVVVRNAPAGTTVAGVPAKPLKR